MKNQLLVLFLSIGYASLFAQTKLIGFSESGEINAANSGGMIWEMNPDGSGFQVLKNFEAQKPIRPIGTMVVGSDSKGYGIVKGFDFDANSQALYQYDFESKTFDVVRIFRDSLWDSPLLLGADGLIYGCRRTSPTKLVICSISLNGEDLAFVHEFDTEGSTKDILQTPEGKIVVLNVDYWPGEIRLLAGWPDGSDWETLASIDEEVYGTETSNIVQKSDGTLLVAIWQYYGSVRFFKINPNDHTYSIFYETTVPDFGDNISLGLAANETLLIVVEKNPGLAVYQIPNEGAPPIEIYYDDTHGSQRGALSKGATGDLYFISTKMLDGTYRFCLVKIKEGNSGTQIINTIYLGIQGSTTGILPIVAHPTNERLYFWRADDYSKMAELFSCKTDGTNLISDYSTEHTGIEPGFSPQELIKGSDGKYYGLLNKGGVSGNGLIFSMNSDGSGFSPLHHLPNAQQPASSWWNKVSCFFEGSDGWLYGSIGDGRIFKVSKDGSGFAIILTDLDPSCNFIERPDGMLYWGGNKLMRMAKDGSDKSVVVPNFITPFVSYIDFCQIFNLPNGKITGIGSYTYDECQDYYIYGFYFSYDPSDGDFKKVDHYHARAPDAMLGNDGTLFFRKWKFDPESSEIIEYNVGCGYLSGVPTTHQATSPAFKESNGKIFGHRSYYNSSTDGRWLPMAWSPENGGCEMSGSWNPSMGYKGRFAFETSTSSTPTVQPYLSKGVAVFPNPTNANAQVLVHMNTPCQATLLVTDLLGRLVFEEKIKVEAGESTFEIPANVLAAKGLYQVSLKTEQGVSSQMLSVY